MQAAPSPRLVAGCSVTGDRDARVYELRRDGPRLMLYMRSRKAGASPVILPLPDANVDVSTTEMALSYSTLNGGRSVEWRITPSAASLDVHANFELEVNVEPDLDPRVELMNTEGPLTKLTCELAPQR
jgi:hypothetical protein